MSESGAGLAGDPATSVEADRRAALPRELKKRRVLQGSPQEVVCVPLLMELGHFIELMTGNI